MAPGRKCHKAMKSGRRCANFWRPLKGPQASGRWCPDLDIPQPLGQVSRAESQLWCAMFLKPSWGNSFCLHKKRTQQRGDGYQFFLRHSSTDRQEISTNQTSPLIFKCYHDITIFVCANIIKIKIHSSCEIEDFVETHLCKLCVTLWSRALRVVCPH